MFFCFVLFSQVFCPLCLIVIIVRVLCQVAVVVCVLCCVVVFVIVSFVCCFCVCVVFPLLRLCSVLKREKQEEQETSSLKNKQKQKVVLSYVTGVGVGWVGLVFTFVDFGVFGGCVRLWLFWGWFGVGFVLG